MATVLAVVIGTSILAFFGCFFLALSQDVRTTRRSTNVEELNFESGKNRVLEHSKSA